MSEDARRQADRLRELAAMETDPAERDRLLETAAEVEGASLTGAGNLRASSEPKPPDQSQ